MIWYVDIYEGDCWRFSTKELAEKCIEFFELEENEYEIYCVEDKGFDDAELLRRIESYKKG